jgi:hypothetical protein
MDAVPIEASPGMMQIYSELSLAIWLRLRAVLWLFLKLKTVWNDLSPPVSKIPHTVNSVEYSAWL